MVDLLHKNTAVAIQEQLKPLGIEVSLLNTDTKTHYAFLQNKGNYDENLVLLDAAATPEPEAP